MKLQTEVEIPQYPFRIDHTQTGLMLGSCFATNIGGWLAEGKMPLVVNPFGVLYNPLSIARALEVLRGRGEFVAEDLFQWNGLWHSPMHHGSFSSTDQDQTLADINRSLNTGRKALAEARYVALTLGTAWVYEQHSTVVANCHKQPASAFTRRRATVPEIVEHLGEHIARRPNTHWIVTVSPVIHLSDGLVENQISKSTLVLAADALCSKYANVHYFPAYEIVTSELRDYRFYDRDMSHPADLAIEHIRERFARALVSEPSLAVMQRIAQFRQAMQHRPLHPDTPEYQKFRGDMHRKILAAQKEWQNIDLTEELQFFS